MSKQSEAWQSQGYTVKGPKCGNCKYRQCDMVLPAWMAADNRRRYDRGEPPVYGDKYAQPKKQRCGIGGFAIKGQGWCVKHEQEPRHD